MQITLKNNLKFAEKEDRDKYVIVLNELFQNIHKDSQQGDQSGVTDDAIDTLKNALGVAIKKINPSVSTENHLSNNMQMTALLAYEAEFFKIIAKKGYDKKYIDIYNKLYGEDTDFQKQLKTFEGKITQDYFINRSAIYGNPPQNQFDAKLEWQKKVSELLSGIKSEGGDKANNKKQIMLPEADEHAAVAFLFNIDPQLMAYIVVNNPITIELKKHKKIDILHEGIIGMKVLCCTFIDTGKLLAPAATLGAAAFVFGGLSLPLTVGVALICLSVELSYYKEENIGSKVDQMQVNYMTNQARQNVDGYLNGEEVNLVPKQLWSPMQLFNVENILKGIIEYICSSYSKHKKEFREKLGAIESLEDLMKYNYLQYKQRNKQRTVSNAAAENFKNHSKDLLGIEIKIM